MSMEYGQKMYNDSRLPPKKQKRGTQVVRGGSIVLELVSLT